MSYKFYTDGVKTIRVSEGEEPPDGFRPGRTFKVNTWNKGLTAETDERVRKNIENGFKKTQFKKNNIPWNKGLTKETSDTLKRTGEKISESCKGRPAPNKGIPMKDESKLKVSLANKGKVAWNKDLTKETDERVASISETLKGHKCFVTDWKAAKEKEYQTHKKNKSFNSSSPEDNYYLQLIEEYGKDNVIRYYKDKRYPYSCDFYIPSEDLFIEYHGSWAHGGHPFDPENKEDLKTLEYWKERAKTSTYYKSNIYTWTVLDVNKLKVAKTNNLNYKAIYPNSGIS